MKTKAKAKRIPRYTPTGLTSAAWLWNKIIGSAFKLPKRAATLTESEG